jgi:flagellar hook-associated protein 1 FlgK
MSNISSFFGLNIALKGLQAHQAALDVTAHNVANQNTVGYTRQSASLVPSVGLALVSGALANGSGAMLGGGVDVQAYVRARDAFTDLQWRVQATAASYADTTEETLSSAQVTLQEPGDTGIASQLGDFWDAWQTLINSPEAGSTDARTPLVTTAQSLVDSVKALDTAIAAVQNDATAQYNALIGPNGDVQTLAGQIAKLNAQIAKETIAGRQPNDLLDARDLAVDQLSALGQVSTTTLVNGSISVSFGGVATPLVSGIVPPATTSTTDFTGLATMTAPGGKLGALLDTAAATGQLQSYRNQLKTFVNQLATNVNAAYGTPDKFFAVASETGAVSTFAVDPAIVASPSTVKANSDGTAGNNDIARAVAALRQGTADKTYTNLVLSIGSDVKQAMRTNDAAQAVFSTIADKRDSVSGVALDEEVTNMLKFQRGYQAASRVMSTMDEMLDKLINGTGRVGL